MRIDAILDIRLRDGIVAEIGERLDPLPEEDTLDARNAYVAPGFIDMHVHLREPGNPEEETIATGVAAAVAGGFTAVAAMPNTKPALDTPDLIRWLKEEAGRANLARVYPIAAITRGREGREPAEYGDLSAAGAVAFSDDGSTIASAIVQTGAALRAREFGRCFITHCEDGAIKANDEFDPAAESSAVARDVAIASATGLKWHIAHVSTRGAIEAIAGGKELGIACTAEATPHHLVFSRESLAGHSGSTKVHPPLRDELDVAALRDAVRNGTIDVLASDHAPHVDSALPGFSGLEVAAGAYAYALRDLPIRRYVELLSTNPARILGVPGGTLEIGSPADLTIFADRDWVVEPSSFHSKGKRTPFAGMTLPRRAIATIVGGALVMQDSRVIARTAL
ncbi:MAG TPA: dihydroorotase [Candidatus Rubrimentiphilum sp.]|nr:dihydroorotase [Candidatus Rubrimentiphilum sp.]